VLLAYSKMSLGRELCNPTARNRTSRSSRNVLAYVTLDLRRAGHSEIARSSTHREITFGHLSFTTFVVKRAGITFYQRDCKRVTAARRPRFSPRALEASCVRHSPCRRCGRRSRRSTTSVAAGAAERMLSIIVPGLSRHAAAWRCAPRGRFLSRLRRYVSPARRGAVANLAGIAAVAANGPFMVSTRRTAGRSRGTTPLAGPSLGVASS